MPKVAPRIAFVTANDPFALTGAGLRMRTTIRALSTIARVDLVSLEGDLAEPEIERGPIGRGEVVAVERHIRMGRSTRPMGVRQTISWAQMQRGPRRLAAADLATERSVLDGLLCDDHDLVWAYKDRAYLALPRPLRSPTIVDLVDYEPLRDRALTRSAAARPYAAQLLRSAVSRLDALALRRLLNRIVDEADLATISTGLDRGLLGRPEVVVVPNAYPVPEHPAGRLEVAEPPVILITGALGYGPNIDAAQWFVEAVLPLLITEVPAATVRLVGRHGDRLRIATGKANVQVVGEVPDIAAELRRADLSVVPIRFGSGSRVKIIEAFAHKIPVVSTTKGAEGLPVVAGRQLLLADTPQAFAHACGAALTDLDLRARIVDAAHDLYIKQLSTAFVEKLIAELASTLLIRTSAP